MRIGPAGALACASHLEGWDFHWQEFHFYKTPPTINPDREVQVTCEYDTSADTAPVLPGGGAQRDVFDGAAGGVAAGVNGAASATVHADGQVASPKRS